MNNQKETWQESIKKDIEKKCCEGWFSTDSNSLDIQGIQSYVISCLSKQREEIREKIEKNLDKHCIYDIGADTLLN